MKIFIAILSTFLCLFLISCQKESGFSNNTGGGSNTGTSTRLVKKVTRSGSDSSVLDFSYNSSGKITGFKLSGAEAGQPLDYRITYVRNSSDIIQKQILKSNDLISAGLDSVVTIVNYDAPNNRYKNGVSVLTLFGVDIKDSITFQYDGTGKLISEIDYADVGFGYQPVSKIEYGYTGSNLANEKIYTYNDATSSFDLEETYTYLYDSKINPLQFSSDAPILNMNPFYSANNITKTTYTDAADPTYNYVSAETYIYNSSNRPASSTNVTGPDTFTTTYYYQ